MIVYLAHPVGHDAEREKNLENVQAWFRFLIDHTDWTICVPWFIYIANLDEAKHRARGIRDDLRMLERCDAIVLTGGRISEGMASELGLAHLAGLKVIDLTKHGYAPTPEAIAEVPSENVLV